MKSKKFKSGFTLVELLVVVSIIGILASIAIFGLPEVTKKGQDTKRLAGFRELELAIAGFRNINGVYPLDGASATEYIQELAPGFIQKLPQDTAQDASNGYTYAVSSDRKSFCLGVKNTVFKNTIAPELVWAGQDKSWKTCRGSTDMTSGL